MPRNRKFYFGLGTHARQPLHLDVELHTEIRYFIFRGRAEKRFREWIPIRIIDLPDGLTVINYSHTTNSPLGAY